MESETVDSRKFISPKELTLRWRCSRSQIDVIAGRAGFTRLCLGEGRNGMVRYHLREVEQYELSHQIKMNTPGQQCCAT
jgi:hypothetical protein